MTSPILASLRQIEEHFEKTEQEKFKKNAEYELRTKNDYAVRMLLENCLKPNQDVMKAVLGAIELLKPFTCHGAENKP
jgi:sugar-specific transcriptional regulator TrmB